MDLKYWVRPPMVLEAAQWKTSQALTGQQHAER
jgi:hypothetical protein